MPPVSPDTDKNAEALLTLIRQLLRELHPGSSVPVGLDSSLERELGLDSLARVELLLRCEQHFSVSLPEQLLAAMETPRDLLRGILAADSGAPADDVAIDAAPLPQAEGEPVAAGSLVEALQWHADMHPERLHVRLLGQHGQQENISYGELAHDAEYLCAGLRRHGLLPGQSVALMLPTGREFLTGFYGTLMAGGIPVPLYPPTRLRQVEEHMRRQTAILANSQAVLLITFAGIKGTLQLLKPQVESLRAIMTAEELTGAGRPAERPALKPQDVALLQYTSGSTGHPKGVILTHANLLANIRAMGKAAEVTPDDVFVSWLPLYHDMGLIGACLGSMYFGLPLVLMSPLSFIARPQRWLQAIHRYRGTLSAAPNFAYELCLRLKDDGGLAGLDLSSWRMAYNGAEPVSAATLERFATRFARYGFRPQAIAPVYGLAESSVGLAFPPPERGAVIDVIKRELFMRQGRAVPAGKEEQHVLRLVACGRPLPGHQIRIVDGTGREVGEREEGQLQFCGPSATSGYFHHPDASAELYSGKWLNSGDYAYMAGGDIYLTGRVKDIIIRAGRNIYPQEIEDAVGSIENIRRGGVAAFASPDPVSGTERLIIMAETREHRPERLEQLRARVNALSVELVGAPPDQVELVPPHTVLKTSSGKIRRAASRQLFERGDISAGRPARPALQLLRLAMAGIVPQCRRSWRLLGHLVYAGYAWLLFLLTATITWPVIATLPGLSRRRRLAGAAARLLLRLSGTPLTIHGREQLPAAAPYVLVANHASYLDGIILAAALPPTLAFAVKRELMARPAARIFLQRLGAEFVERFDARRGAEDVSRLLKRLQAGESLAVIPEGTFGRAPGLRPFHMGAFVIAAKAGAPVVPVAIRGSRSMLRGDSFFPRRGIIGVIIGKPIKPDGSGWHDAIRLRDRARAEILRHCGEPDLRQDTFDHQPE